MKLSLWVCLYSPVVTHGLCFRCCLDGQFKLISVAQCFKVYLLFFVKITKIPLPHPGHPTPISFVMSAFSFILLPLQLSAPFVCNSSFQLCLSALQPPLHLSTSTRLSLSDINDVYSLDVFLLKTSQSTRLLPSSITTV